MIIERNFIGTQTLEEVLQPFLEYYIDKLIDASYDTNRTNAIPNNKGVAK